MAAKELDGSAAGQPILRISADAVEPERRAAFVSDEVSARLVSAQAEAVRGRVPRFDYSILDVGAGARIIRGELDGLDIARTNRHLIDGDDNLTLFLALGGELHVDQDDRRVALRRGEAVMVSNTRPVLTRFGDARFAMLQLPRRAVFRGPDAGPCRAGAQRMLLLGSYMLAVFRQAKRGPVPAVAACHLQELASATFAGQASSDGRVAAMREIMVRRHAEPDLSMRVVAAALGLSERSGHLAFRAAGLRFSEELIGIRLDRARARLKLGAPRVLDVALDVGFTDLSHFNRRFRDRFGMTPSQSRG